MSCSRSQYSTSGESRISDPLIPSLTLYHSAPQGIKVNAITVKPVLRGHSKIDKTKILMTNGTLMKVESIAERSP